MRILLDENLPIKLKSYITKDHDIRTVHEMNWSGLKNGDLLNLLVVNKFDIFITGDKNIKFQQNITKLNVSIILLDFPNLRIDTLKKSIKRVNNLLNKKLNKGLTELK